MLILYDLGVIPTISTSIWPLSGELCPGRVTFSCDFLDTRSPIIDYYINDTRLFRYEFLPSHTFPLTVNESLPGIIVQITSANINNNKYSFMNFTLSADFNDIIIYQEQWLTCGTVSVRSNSVYMMIKGEISYMSDL